VSQKSETDPPYLQLAGEPIQDLSVTNYTLIHFRHQIEASGWSTVSTATTPAPINATYSGDLSFQALLDEVASDFGICVAVDQSNLRVSFSNCP